MTIENGQLSPAGGTGERAVEGAGPYKETQKAEQKGRMARRLVYYCIGVLSVTALWAAVIVTVAVVRDVAVDLSAVLTFIGAAFGGELLMLLLKRVFAKPTGSEE